MSDDGGGGRGRRAADRQAGGRVGERAGGGQSETLSFIPGGGG